MMKTYKCGHQVVGSAVPVYGGVKTNEPCPQCHRAANVARATSHARKHALPDLTGSPNQVMWAMTIRHRAIADVQTKSAELKVRVSKPSRVAAPGVVAGQTELIPTPPGRDAALLNEMLYGLALLRAETNADWWIANRSQSVWHWLGAIVNRNHGE